MRSSNLIEGKPEKITKKNSQSSKIKKKQNKQKLKKIKTKDDTKLNEIKQ